MKFVSIILATLNESDNLLSLLNRIGNSVNFDYEIIFIDDGSTDGTRDIILKYSETHNNCRYIFGDRKSGTAIAKYKGILEARGDYLIIMDSDLQHPPEKLMELFNAMEEGYDFVVFSRYLTEGSVGNRMPIRGVISRIAGFVAKIFLKEARQLSDPLSNFIGFRANLNIPEIKWFGYEIQLAILSFNPDLKIRELPYVFHEREKGSSSVTSTMRFPLIFLKEMLRYAKIDRVSEKAIESWSEMTEFQR